MEASVKAYAPEAELLIFSPKKETSAKSYDVALKEVFKTYDEVIVCADDIVLTPTSYQLLIEDINALKERHGDKVGFVAAHADFSRYTQNIRYQQLPTDKLEYGKWSWEHECRPVKRLSPLFHYLSKKMYDEVAIAPIEWYSDDVWCEDLNALGYHHYISRSYVHHVGSQSLGSNTQKLHDEAIPWLVKNRPQYLDLFFGEGARQRMEKKLKVAVYTITKNEEQFIERWAKSAQEADLLLIADTGSTDRTVEIAKENGVVVHEICVTPWRFDHARNASLMLIPKDYDVCICLDADEVMEPGWREELERVWTPGTTHLRYKFDWSLGVIFYSQKIHARHGYYWHHPCHEHIRADMRIQEVWAHTDFLMITHHPDPTKSRGHYMETLELSVKEDPTCPRNAFYYARELSFQSRWDESIQALKKYLAMPEANWPDERSYAMRVMGKCYSEKGNLQEAEKCFHQAASEALHAREPWCELAMLMYKMSRWTECYAYAMRALDIKDRQLVYTCDPAAWGYWAHDLASISAWRIGLKDVALEQAKLAVNASPNDPRLQSNLEWIEKELGLSYDSTISLDLAGS